MQVVHISFTYLLLTLIYFHLEFKTLVRIPDSLLDSGLALRGKEGDIVRRKPQAYQSKRFGKKLSQNLLIAKVFITGN